jgi:dipeptidyl aminopeptidase/acylaminoacyl peptidase
MGLIKDPGQYRCGVSWSGVTDLDYLFSLSWSDASEVTRRYGLVALIGDREADAERLRRTSPLRRAADLQAPLLIGHGLDDRRVPIDHASDLRRALEKAGHSQVEYVTYPGEGHAWRMLSTKTDFYGRMERFLARHLGAAPGQAP